MADKEQKEYLIDCVSELSVLESYIDACMYQDQDINPDIALFLSRAASEKLDYFSKKYGFEVPTSEQFFVYDFSDFIRRTEGLPTTDERVEKIRAEAGLGPEPRETEDSETAPAKTMEDLKELKGLLSDGILVLNDVLDNGGGEGHE